MLGQELSAVEFAALNKVRRHQQLLFSWLITMRKSGHWQLCIRTVR